MWEETQYWSTFQTEASTVDRPHRFCCSPKGVSTVQVTLWEHKAQSTTSSLWHWPHELLDASRSKTSYWFWYSGKSGWDGQSCMTAYWIVTVSISCSVLTLSPQSCVQVVTWLLCLQSLQPDISLHTLSMLSTHSQRLKLLCPRQSLQSKSLLSSYT